ncbi:hypothetical protein FJZ40_00600 [Candidatus Shapirobacteria bacterium]|nr:hypothetical protein [Candidatus Shapirobacteria bacterium]
MKYLIDQSGKIEQTEKDTVLALANDIKFTVLIRARDKRIIQQEFKLRGRPRNFVLFTFSLLIVLLLKKVKPKSTVFIDQEYKGNENIVRDRMANYSRRLSLRLDQSLITFKSLGKTSPAHYLAGIVADRKTKPNKVISLEEVLPILFQNKKTGHSERNRGVFNAELSPFGPTPSGGRHPSRSISRIYHKINNLSSRRKA